VLAARRLGVKEVILPRQNDKDVKEDLSDELRKDLTIHLVSTIDEAVLLALTPPSTSHRERRTATRVQGTVQ
jgi:ATP-dependent Lon protease